MEKIIVFDFDKTLTNYDTTLPFFIFCCKKRPIKYLLLTIFIFVKISSKFKLITIKKEKEIGIKLFCPTEYDIFKEYCIQFSKKIKLNHIYQTEFKKLRKNNSNKIIIASASFSGYLKPLFPNTQIVGTEVKVNNNKIVGIKQHPFGESKKNILVQKRIKKIDVFYTDSINDLPTSKLSVKTNWVFNGKIKQVIV